MKTFILADGKYTVTRDDAGLVTTMTRHGEPWPAGASAFAHAGFVHALLDRVEEAETKPIDMVLYCPNCGEQHVDAPEPHCKMGVECDESGCCYAEMNGAPDRCERWTNPPHRSHLCHSCGTIWRPADVPTNGVTEIKTQGKADSWVVRAEEVRAQKARR